MIRKEMFLQVVVILISYYYFCDSLIYSSFSHFHSYSNSVFRRYVKSERSLTSDRSPAFKQLQIQFNCDDVDSDEISELLIELGTSSVSVEVLSEKDTVSDPSKWFDLIKTKSWATAILRANFPNSFDANGLTEILQSTFPEVKFEYDIIDVADKDWVTEVQKSWLPLQIGNLQIRFPWNEEEVTINNEAIYSNSMIPKRLILEGGAAFGTGDHPTTRLCCLWLEKQFIGDESSTSSVLDYGCGSAILGLAALRYGVERAVGVDIDKDALVSAANNCEMNNLDMKFYLANDDDNQSAEEKTVVNNILKGYQSTSFTSVVELENEGPVFDVVVANILAPILCHLAPKLANHLKVSNRYKNKFLP